MTVEPSEFPFELPLGYEDSDGEVHKEGRMRLATAKDEIAPLKDHRVQANPGYLIVILLSRVITGLGELRQVTPKVIEGLYAGDLAFLQDFYQRLNHNGHGRVAVACPECETQFEVEVGRPGGASATPRRDSLRR